MTRRQLTWLRCAAVLLSLGAAALIGGLLVCARTDLPSPAAETLGMPVVLVIPPLAVLCLAVVARLGLGFGWATLPTGELDRLVGRKRQGLLVHGLRRILWRPARRLALPLRPEDQAQEVAEGAETAIRRKDGADYRADDAHGDVPPQ
jgi:hypothetical protein